MIQGHLQRITWGDLLNENLWGEAKEQAFWIYHDYADAR